MYLILAQNGGFMKPMATRNNAVEAVDRIGQVINILILSGGVAILVFIFMGAS